MAFGAGPIGMSFDEVDDDEAKREDKANISFKRRVGLQPQSPAPAAAFSSSLEKPLSAGKRRLSAQLDQITKQINSPIATSRRAASIAIGSSGGGGGSEKVSFMQDVDSVKAKKEVQEMTTTPSKSSKSKKGSTIEEDDDEGLFKDIDDSEAKNEEIEEEEYEEKVEHDLYGLDHLDIDTRKAQLEKRRGSRDEEVEGEE